MEIKNLKINFLGDSITEGKGTSSEDKVYWRLIESKYGAGVVRGYGIGGTRFAIQTKPSEKARHDLDFCNRYSEMDDDADLVVVFGGTNDFGHGDAPIGSFEDRTPYTFYGACHTLFEGLINKYPDSTIVIMTPLHRSNEDDPRGDGFKAQDVGVLSTYVDIIKQVAAYYSLPLLDLWSVSSIQPRVQILREKYCPDGLHPNDAGHELIASRLAGFISTL